MKVKKILAGITALCMLYGAIPASNQQKIFIGKTMTANAADSYSENSGTTENGLQYSINSDSESIRITRYSGSEKNVEIPASINGLPVTSIGDWAFSGCIGLTSITIPDSVTSIDWCAFSGCTGLTEITIPDSVTSIGYAAFGHCTGLTSINADINSNHYSSIDGVLFSKDKSCLISYPIGKSSKKYTIPDSVTSIGQVAFGDCTGLTEITIPNSVTSIDNSAFSNCTELTSITIPNSVTSIEGYAFSGCTGLTEIAIPDSVTSIGGSAFLGCTGLTAINADVNSNHYSSIDGVLFSKDKSCLISYPIGKSNKKYTIPDSVTSIGEDAFYVCTGLIEITIPDSVTSIGRSAFSSCTGLTSITIPNSVTSIDDWAFDCCTGLTSITIPDSVTNIGYNAFSNTAWYENQPDGLVYAGKLVYTYKGEMPENTELILNNDTLGIANGAFEYRTELTSITMPDSVTNIDDWAFANCTGLTSITIPASVTSIDDSAFSGCTGLTEIIIKNPECEIGDSTDTISDTAAIYGYDDSTAQAYAEKYNRKFVSLGEKPNIPISKTGDADLNGTIDAIDASIALTIYALNSTGGDVSSYTDEQLDAADADKNGTVDAIDASHTLSYYAYISTGGSKTFDEFIG